MVSIESKLLSIIYGLVCHSIFLLAGAIMFLTILTGFQYSIGSSQGLVAIVMNVLSMILLFGVLVKLLV